MHGRTEAENNHYEARSRDARREHEQQSNAVEKDSSTNTNRIVLGKCTVSVVASTRWPVALGSHPSRVLL